MLQIEADCARPSTDAAAVRSHTPAPPPHPPATMKLLGAAAAAAAASAALLALLAIVDPAQARPEGSPAMTETTMEAHTPTSAPMDSSHSHEADSSSEEDKNITVLAKTAVLCPPQQPELQAIEAECLAAVDPSCLPDNSAGKSNTEMTTEAPSPSTTETTMSSGEQCKSACNYHLCILEKLEVLDSFGKPNKMLLSNWIAHNITDEKQKQQLQHKLSQCPIKLSDRSSEDSSSSEDSKSSEEKDEKKSNNPNSKCCKAARKVAHCVFNVECPVIKLL